MTRRSSKRSVFRKGNGPLIELFVPPDWPFFWSENYGWFCSVSKQSSHRVLQNLAFEFLLQMTKIFKSSTESTNSTSLIQCIASVGNCEQVHTSVLNLIFQQANVAGVGECVKMKIWNLQSLLVCSIILWRISLTGGWLNFWLTVRTGISDLELVFDSHSSPPLMSELVPTYENSLDSIPADKVLLKTRLDLQKRFPIYHVCPKCLAAHLCGSAFL